MPELWFSRPRVYINELVAMGVNRLLWRKMDVEIPRIDPQRHALFHYPSTMDFRVAVVGDYSMAVMDRDHPVTKPLAAYPVWRYGDHSLESLEHLLEENRAEELRAQQLEKNKPPLEVPVVGQDHVVAVTQMPNLQTNHGRKFLFLLMELQDEYPDATIHLHGVISYSALFGGNFKSVDYTPIIQADRGAVVLPDGKNIYPDDLWKYHDVLRYHGFTPTALERDKSERLRFGIKSAMWANENWNADTSRYRVREHRGLSHRDLVDVVNGSVPDATPTGRQRFKRRGGPLPGDKLYCGACSFAQSCKVYREGSVCSVGGTEMNKIAQLFSTRDSSRITEGLAKIIELDLERLDMGVDGERDSGELDPRVTKLTENVFKHGTALAKLVDPALRSAALAIHLNASGTVQIEGGKTYQAMAADAIQALEEGGVPRDMITGELVQKCIDATSATDLELIIANAAAKYSLPSGIFEADEFDPDED